MGTPISMTTTAEASAHELAELVLAMDMVTPRGIVARQLARRVLGVDDATNELQCAAIVTNGTLRLIPREEPVFLLRGQDALAPLAVRFWANSVDKCGVGKTASDAARQHAERMEAWLPKKLPDWPPALSA
jgi:hypothetical protein